MAATFASSALLIGCGDGEADHMSPAGVAADDGAAGATSDGTNGTGGAGNDAGKPGGKKPRPSSGAGGAGEEPEAGGAGGAGGDHSAPIDPDALRFENVICEHTLAGLQSVVEGQAVNCTFDVLGKAGDSVVLGCEDTQGKVIDCGINSLKHGVWPDGDLPVPVDFAGFWHNTEQLGGATISLVLVARGATETARHRIEVAVDPDNGEPDAPTLSVDCGQEPGVTTIEVEAGEKLVCTGIVVDLDPDMLEYSIDLASADTPEQPAIPASGGLWGTGLFDWTFSANAADVGKSFEYTFTVNDYVHTPVSQTFAIVVK